MSCTDPNASQELKSVCACQKAVNVFAESFKSYEASKVAHATAKAIYDAAWIKYQNDLRDWETKKANKRKDLVDETKVWNNCVVWTDVYGHDNWCQSDTGFGRQTGAGQHGCIWSQGKGVCQRTDYQVNEELNKWQGSNPAPIPPSGGSNGNVTPCGSSCNPPTGNNILCCSSVISDITAGKNVSINEAINCTQNLVSQAAAIGSAPSPSTTIPLPSAPSTTAPSPSVVPSKTTSRTNNWTTLFIISAFVLFIWGSIILSFLLI
jgi:hypothetical protein